MFSGSALISALAASLNGSMSAAVAVEAFG
jgi:hypothetical protein